MKMITEKPLEDCFTESLTREVDLDEPISEAFIRHLGRVGDLQYFPSFARPFFRVDIEGKCSISGIEGNRSMRVTLCHDGKVETLRGLRTWVEDFATGPKQ
jgi:hypothetical protein